ncbi:MAG: OmpA family protein [Candidatus Binatia bacterium]
MRVYGIGQRTVSAIFGVFFLLSLQGCLATRGWVTEQIVPLDARVSQVETGLMQTNARVDGIIDRLDHLRLEKRFVLNLKEGASFGYNSDDLTADTRSEIDGFLSDLETTEDTVFLVAGHTDSVGPDDYNYELGQKRAANVARYLMAHKGIDPLSVTTVSYGESTPLANNATREGRRQNRRIEILVYKEAITSAPRQTPPRSEAYSRTEGFDPLRGR